MVSEARLAPIASAMSPTVCSGGSEAISQPMTRPVIGANPHSAETNAATCSTQFRTVSRWALRGSSGMALCRIIEVTHSYSCQLFQPKLK